MVGKRIQFPSRYRDATKAERVLQLTFTAMPPITRGNIDRQEAK
jgi:hypothetical protein